MNDDLYDLLAERTLIGWMLVRSSERYEVTRYVTLADFADVFSRTAFGELTARSQVTVQQLAAMHDVLRIEDLRRCVEDARFRDPREVNAVAVRVAERALARRAASDAEETIIDAHNATIDSPELVRRVKARAAAMEAPDAPPPDVAVPFPEYMAGTLEDHDWLIPDLVERRERIIVTATGGVGKTTLLRQFALCAAAGRHPFWPDKLLPKPVRVLLLDLENSRRQVRMSLRSIASGIGRDWDGEFLHIRDHTDVLDVTESAGYRWLFGQAMSARPDMVVAGPIYRLYEGGDTSRDTGGRDKARRVIQILDQLRERHNCALLLEAHPPKGSSTLSPFGSAVFEWWPDQGLGLQPTPEGPNIVTLKEWRFPRDVRQWPKTLQRGGAVGWKVLDDGRGGASPVLGPYEGKDF